MLHLAPAYYLHDLNPVIFEIWFIKTRWYGLAYLLGFLFAYLLLKKQARDGMLRLHPDRVADLVLNCCIFGVLIGGRLGFCLFYDLPNAIKTGQTPLLWFTGPFPYWGVLRVWEGGMSAHGGIVFTILTLIFFARKYKLSVVNLGDAACMVVPIGLCFGRIANFINGELYGRIASVPWAVKFPSEIWSPTNGVQTISSEKLMDLQDQVAAYLAAHPHELTIRQIQDFLANNPNIAEKATQQFGTLQLGRSPSQLTALQDWLGTQFTLHHEYVGMKDLANWWEHSTAAFHTFLHGQFDAILSPRHPSQIYEALLEGLLLFLICYGVGRLWRKDGMASGAFLTLYPVMRIIGEQFRVGDTSWRPFGVEISDGVIYSLPLVLAGAVYWGYWIRRNRRVPWSPPSAASAPAQNDRR